MVEGPTCNNICLQKDVSVCEPGLTQLTSYHSSPDMWKTHQTQTHFTGFWHKMGFLCLSTRGAQWQERNTSRGEGYIIADARLDVSCGISDNLSPEQHVKRSLHRRPDFRQPRENSSAFKHIPPSHRRLSNPDMWTHRYKQTYTSLEWHRHVKESYSLQLTHVALFRNGITD